MTSGYCFYQNPCSEHLHLKAKCMPKLHHEDLHSSNSTSVHQNLDGKVLKFCLDLWVLVLKETMSKLEDLKCSFH